VSAFVFPVFVCEIGFGSNPGDASPSWTDVSAYLRGFSISRGRQYELNQSQAGTCNITLKNLDRRFDPTYTSSPYYPNIVPMVPVRISATFQSVTYRLFTGYVERFPQNRTGPTYAETVIQAVDGFELLTNAVLPGDTYPSELTGTRVGRTLDAASWSSSARNLATGQSTVAAYTFADADNIAPLPHLQAVADSELGAFYMSNDGRATFLDRHTSFGVASAATFSDQPATDAGSIGYSDMQTSYDKDLIYTDVRVVPSSGVYQEALDSALILKYFLRLLPRTVLLSTDADALSQAEYLLSLYKNPALRVAQITVTPGTSATAWVQALVRELSDRITTREHPPGGGDSIVLDSFIQQIDFSVGTDPAGAKVTWGLLPAAVQGFWRASYSQASVDTRAGY